MGLSFGLMLAAGGSLPAQAQTKAGCSTQQADQEQAPNGLHMSAQQAAGGGGVPQNLAAQKAAGGGVPSNLLAAQKAAGGGGVPQNLAAQKAAGGGGQVPPNLLQQAAAGQPCK